MDAVELAISITSSAVDAGFDAIGDSARQMAQDVDAATSGATAAASRLDGIGASAENLDSKAGAATGALGALSSGFELVGAQGAADTLVAASMATDFLSGASQALNLILGLESLQHIKATATTLAHSAATTAASAAAKAAAAGQWLLNAALSANPIGVIILLVVALVAGFVLLYRRSETVQAIVTTVFKVIKTYIDLTIGSVISLVSWVAEKAGPAWSILRAGVVAAIDIIKGKFEPMATAAREVFEKARTIIGEAIDAAKDKVEWLKDQAGIYFDAMLAPINAIKDAVQGVIDKVASLKFPSPPDWLDKLVPGGSNGRSTAGYGSSSLAPVVININVDGSGIVDPNALGATLTTTIADYLTRTGRQVVTG